MVPHNEGQRVCVWLVAQATTIAKMTVVRKSARISEIHFTHYQTMNYTRCCVLFFLLNSVISFQFLKLTNSIL